jgi:hypothetical protein
MSASLISASPLLLAGDAELGDCFAIVENARPFEFTNALLNLMSEK